MTSKKRYSEVETMSIVAEYHAGRPAIDICNAYGISKSTFYFWLSKHSHTGSKRQDQNKTLKAENLLLKKLLAERVLEIFLDRGLVNIEGDILPSVIAASPGGDDL